MFTGFPPLTPHLLNLLYRQAFRYMVQQPFPGGPPREKYLLLSPFFAKDKAEYYLKRLRGKPALDFYNLHIAKDRDRLITLAAGSACFVKTLANNFRLDKETRNLIADKMREQYPAFFEKMLHSNFRIAIGDNFGEVFFTIRVGQEQVQLTVQKEDWARDSKLRVR